MTELARLKEALDLAIGELSKKARHMYPDGVTCEEACHRTLLAINAVLHPAPIMEEVEVKRWHCMTCGDTADYSFDICRNAHADIVELTGTVQREKKVPVERSVDIRLSKFGELVELSANGRDIDIREAYGKSGVFTWPEEPTT